LITPTVCYLEDISQQDITDAVLGTPRFCCGHGHLRWLPTFLSRCRGDPPVIGKLDFTGGNLTIPLLELITRIIVAGTYDRRDHHQSKQKKFQTLMQAASIYGPSLLCFKS